ncbi:hypothetical protein JB92DRAFT_3132712 [Gautieria morchelliformis]|nr:hypothetical protein JB92DRAFT_3132712 [Gautieria morchelliformis]
MSTLEQLDKELLASCPPDLQPDPAAEATFIQEMGIDPSLETGPYQPRAGPGQSTSTHAGPYRVKEAQNDTLTVTLELPEELTNWRIMPTFHTSLIRRYEVNSDDLFPRQEAKSFYDFGENNEEEWLINEILSHRWINLKDLEFQVRWTLGEVTWEPMSSCKDLKALDTYLELRGMAKTCDLPKQH